MMRWFDKFADKDWKVYLFLIFSGLAIYFGYYHSVLLNANSVLSGITGDALKNYYTYAFHITNDSELLHFSGMNFPYGEHVVYTDCQPLLTFLLRLFPFTHQHLIGILHWLLFASFIVTPLIFYRIFQRLNIDKLSSFFISLGITLLSPQFGKIFGGHHGLAYGCFIPLSILFILEYQQKKQPAILIKICLYNFLLFFIHPYLGFSSSVFTFLSLSFFFLFDFRREKILMNGGSILISGVLPIILFKLFMVVTDQHLNRTGEPQGLNVLVENIDSILAPDFGPFQNFLETIFQKKIQHLEGHSYLGVFVIFLALGFFGTLPFLFKKYFFRKELLALLSASMILLFISFGLHYRLFDVLHLKISALDQFRAVCRFAWTFYYVLPIFLFSVIYHSLEPYFENRSLLRTFKLLSLLFFLLNFVEANYYYTKDQNNFWKFRNVFNEACLNSEEKKIIRQLKTDVPQAILPLPLFHIGSETYARLGGDNSMIPAMIYSYHANVPIMGVSMSRTSITETENEIQLLNSYKRIKSAAALLKDLPFFVIKTEDALLPDEDRLLSKFKYLWRNDSLQMGYISKAQLLLRKSGKYDLTLNAALIHSLDTSGVIFIPTDNKKPFTNTISRDYETIYILDSNKVRSGSYIVSFHNYYANFGRRKEFPTLIITRGKGKDYKWQYYQSTRLLSGFYSHYDVFEYPIDLEGDCRYEFVLKADSDMPYHISDFMLRPADIAVMGVNGNDTIINNFSK
ncbi:MAG: hypothetical protein PSX36_05710 [bacterium]|nr:hypothetical protein [bacterium]